MSQTEKPPFIELLQLTSVTCFGSAEFKFVRGVNAFVGPNGTGKTHALKLLYLLEIDKSKEGPMLEGQIRELFQISQSGELRRAPGWETFPTRIRTVHGDTTQVFTPTGHGIHGSWLSSPGFPRPVFIPASDVMAHTKGFLEADRLVALDFDSTFRDLVSLLAVPSRAEMNGSAMGLEKLKEVVPGEIEQDESKRFYLSTDQGRFPMPMVAEGIRKVATLRRLIENNWLVEGSALFWDEPEANLSPAIMEAVAQAILLLARNGVQVFLATHSYLMLKELEVGREEGDSLRFFSFEDSADGVRVTPADTYLDMHPNPIEDSFASLYDRDVQRDVDRASAGN